jgi:hypothetical protein
MGAAAAIAIAQLSAFLHNHQTEVAPGGCDRSVTGRRVCVRKTPDRPRPEFLVLWFEVQVMHNAGKVFLSFQFAIDKRLVDDHLGGDLGQFPGSCLEQADHFRSRAMSG